MSETWGSWFESEHVTGIHVMRQHGETGRIQDIGADYVNALERDRADLNTALSLLSAYGRHLTSCHVWTEVMIDGRLIGPAYPCTCGYAERVAPFLQRMSEVKG